MWRLRVYVGRRANGSPIQRSKIVRAPDAHPKPGAGTRLADNVLAEMVREANRGRQATGAETFGDLLDAYLEHCRTLGRSQATLETYNRLADKVLRPELGKIKLAKLSARDLDRLYSKLVAKGNRATTVRRAHALASGALRQGERWGIVERSVARQASPPPIQPAEVRAPSPEEVRRIVETAESVDPTLATMLVIAALTGARRGELVALRWPDLNWTAGVLTIARSIYEGAGGGWVEGSTKTHQVRRVGLDEFGLQVLRRHRAAVELLASENGATLADDAFMFSRSPSAREPIRPNVVSRFLARTAKKAKVDTHLHALRHFSATTAIAAGYDPVTVAARLGHRDSSITLRTYSHALEQRDRALAATLGRALGPVDTQRVP